jgi:hypothetical protein
MMRSKDIRLEHSSGISTPYGANKVEDEPEGLVSEEQMRQDVVNWIRKKADPIDAANKLKVAIENVVDELRDKNGRAIASWGDPFKEFAEYVRSKHAPFILSHDMYRKVAGELISSSTIAYFSPWTGRHHQDASMENLIERVRREKLGASGLANKAEESFFETHHPEIPPHLTLKRSKSTYCNPALPHILATPDGLCYEDGKIVATIEIKSSEVSPVLPTRGTQTFTQIQCQMLVLRVKTAYLCCLFKQKWEVYEIRQVPGIDQLYSNVSISFSEVMLIIASRDLLEKEQELREIALGKRKPEAVIVNKGGRPRKTPKQMGDNFIVGYFTPKTDAYRTGHGRTKELFEIAKKEHVKKDVGRGPVKLIKK